MKKSLIILLFLFLSFFTYSQTPVVFEKGYVVLKTGNTLFGFIKKITEEGSARMVIFINNEGKRTKYTSEELSAYKRGQDLYVTKRANHIAGFKKMNVFMKVMELGKVNLYAYYYTLNSGGLVSEMGILSSSPSHQLEYYIEKKNQNLEIITRLNFKNKLTASFSDQEALVMQIEEKELKYRHLKEIVKIYNNL